MTSPKLFPLKYCQQLSQYLAQLYLCPGVSPYPYQLAAVQWMLMRESVEYYGVYGGVDGMAMGTGKTMQFLLLHVIDRWMTYQTPICVNKTDLLVVRQLMQIRRQNSPPNEHPATIVLATKEARRAWVQSMDTLFKPGVFKCTIAPSLASLKHVPRDVDFVFLSPGLVTSKNFPTDIPHVFRRLIFDEAHENGAPNTEVARGIKLLQATFRWAISASLVTNSIADLLVIFYSCLQCREPRLVNWSSVANPPTSALALCRAGLDFNYLENILLALGIFRARSSDIEARSIQELDAARLFNWLLAIPPTLALSTATLARHPTLAWEVVYHAQLARDRNVELLGADVVQPPVVSIHQAQNDIDVFYSYTETSQEGGGPLITHDQWEVERIYMRLCLFDAADLSPSHAQLRKTTKEQSLEAIRQYREQLRFYQTIYQALLGSFQHSQTDAALQTLRLTAYQPQYHFVFIRSAINQIESIALDYLATCYINKTREERLSQEKDVETTKLRTSNAAVASSFNFFVYLREVAFHLDLLLVTQHERAFDIFAGCPPVLEYYKAVWREAQLTTASDSRQAWLTWIMKTSWRRYISTKMHMMAQYWEHAVFNDEKVICFAFFIGSLHILSHFFEDAMGVKTRILKGSDNEDTRNKGLEEMRRRTSDGPRLLLATENSFAASGNMTFANHVWQPHSWWNLRHEDQENGRVHRPGQLRPTYCSSFLLAKSVDVVMRKYAQTKELLRAAAQFGSIEDHLASRPYIDTGTNVISPLTVLAAPEDYSRDFRTVPETLGSAAISQTATRQKTSDIEQYHRAWIDNAARLLRSCVDQKTMQVREMTEQQAAPLISVLPTWPLANLPLSTYAFNDDSDSRLLEGDGGDSQLDD